jgi:hypothetical protein
MPSTITTALRRRISFREVLLYLLILAAVFLFTDSIVTVVGIAFAWLFVAGTNLLRDTLGVDERLVKVGFAVLWTVASVVWIWFERSILLTDVRNSLPILAVVVGLWLLLDARADFVQNRRRTTPDGFNNKEPDFGDVMLIMIHLRLVADELSSGPKTVSQLASACNITESRVREAIEAVSDDGTIYQVDNTTDEPRYAVDEQKLGASGFGLKATGGITSMVNRVIRPLREQI